MGHVCARGMVALVWFLALPHQARSEQQHLLASATPSHILIYAEGGDHWCSEHLALRMQIDPSSQWFRSYRDPVRLMNKLGKPIAIDCPQATAAEIQVVRGENSRTYYAAASSNWMFQNHHTLEGVPAYAGLAGRGSQAGPAGHTIESEGFDQVGWVTEDQPRRGVPIAHIDSQKQPGADDLCGNPMVKDSVLKILRHEETDPMFQLLSIISPAITDVDITQKFGGIAKSASVGTDTLSGDVLCSAVVISSRDVAVLGNKADAAQAEHDAGEAAEAEGRYSEAQNHFAASNKAQSDEAGAELTAALLKKLKDTPTYFNFGLRKIPNGYHMRDVPAIMGSHIYSMNLTLGNAIQSGNPFDLQAVGR